MAAGRNNMRRRRVILGEAVQSSDVVAFESEANSHEAVKTYSDAARRRGQLKTTDLIPKRPLPLAIVVATVVLSAVLLNFFALTLGTWESLSESAQNIFRFSGVGTLPNWFSSLLLVTTGMASLQIYGMRRHRCDDYNGHYQIWLFLAVLFAIASLNCVVDFHAFFVSLAKLSGFSGGNGFVVFLVAKLIALTALVVRGIMEIRASRAAFVAVIVVWVAYGCAIVAQIPDVQQHLVQENRLIVGNLVLIGNIAVFLTSVFYSRFVYLHANELIEMRRTEPKAIAKSSDKAVKKTKSKTTSKSKQQPLVESAPQKETTKEDVKPETESKPILKLQQRAAEAGNKKRARKLEKQQRRAA